MRNEWFAPKTLTEDVLERKKDMDAKAIDYTAMSGPDLLAALGDDGAKWAAAFCQHAKKLGHGDIDEGWMIGWFANAIEHSHDVRTGSGPVVLPDGSAFFVGTVG